MKSTIDSSKINVLIQKYDSFALNEEEYWSINTYDYNPHVDYESRIWELFNIPDDVDIENINSDLKSIDGIDLKDQFKNNSGTWYIEEPGNLKQLQKARTVIEKLKHFFT